MPLQTQSSRKPKSTAGGETFHGTIFLAENGRFAGLRDKLTALGFDLISLGEPREQETLAEPVLFVVDGSSWKSYGEEIAEFLASCHYTPPTIQIDDGGIGIEEPPNLSALLTAEFTERQALIAVREAFRTALLRREIERLTELHQSDNSELQKLIEIGISLSSERNIGRLLDKILLEACNVTTADAGSIYIIDQNEVGEKVLHFSNTLSASLNVDFKEFSIPLNKNSIAGYVAMTGESLIIDDCYHIPDRYQLSINKSFDEGNNYRTKSMLAVAMRNQKDEIIGVIQLINRKPLKEMILSSPQVVEETVLPFNEKSQSLIDALASQAAVALENYRLYRDIENLFEGFVQASVTAIESRDPTTCGHSERVATLTVGIAEMVNRTSSGPLKNVHFSENQLKEIRYAGLLHDFGKVGVREDVLLKAKKLFPEHLELIKKRFDIARQIYRKETNRAKVDYLLQAGRQEYLRQFKNIDVDMEKRLEALDRYLGLIIKANEPTVLAEDHFSVLEEIARKIVADPDEQNFPLLDNLEYQVLSIPRGSLTPEERKEIESHVTHTFNFLIKIPWTRELQEIPEIAYGHHEKLDGTGYPRGISSGMIYPQTRMMTISDIYDALTATDRPYKPAVPIPRALDILAEEVKEGKIDGHFFDVFVKSKVFEHTAKGSRESRLT